MAVLDADLPEALLGRAVASLIGKRRDDRRRQLQTRPRQGDPPELICASPRAQAVIDTARRVALADSTVLILGETGVGKERIAELIHRASTRSAGPFVPVNCAAIPTELFESELFGHERGAFTGAHRARRGLFELAHEGTLFLDEVGEVPQHLQPKLLRALQERRIRPLGSNDVVEIDVRVVAATNRDLATEMAAGAFRRDLYYRLAVVEVSIPPLRERPEDVVAMAPVFVERFVGQLGRQVDGFEPEAVDAMRNYGWPGNVRELVNVVERAVLLCEGERIGLSDLPPAVAACASLDHPSLGSDAADAPAGTADLERIVRMPTAWSREKWKIVREGILLAGERAYLGAVLAETHGRVGEAAKRAGLSNRALFEKMRRHGLRKEDFRNAGSEDD
jgi:DNA-binding NtrC family response regulator